MRGANASYFREMGEPMMRGRTFNNMDVADGPPVAIITRGLAHDLYGDTDPVGQLISSCTTATTGAGLANDRRRRRRHTRERTHDEPPREMYMPSAQWQENSTMAYLMRGSVPVTTLRRRYAGRSAVDPISRYRAPPNDGRGVRRTPSDSAIHDVAAHPARRDGTRVGDRRRLRSDRVPRVAAYPRIRRAHGARRRGRTLQWMVVREGIVLGVVGVVVGTAVASLLARFLAR